MQPEADQPANPFFVPPGNSESPQLDSALRGLGILQGALIVALVASILGGAARAYIMGNAMDHGGGMSHSGNPLLDLLFKGWPLIFIGTAIAELFALAALVGAPPAARVANLARAAVALRAVELVLTVGVNYLGEVVSSLLQTGQLSRLYLYESYLGTAIDLINTVLLVETLLRLRRFAAPTDRALAENEGLVRAGLLGAMMARTVANFASYAVGFRVFGMGSSGQWAVLAIRLPFMLLFIGLLLWLVQATATALRCVPPPTAVAGQPAALPWGSTPASDTSPAAYRNMLLGGLWALGGIGVTLATYQSAGQLGGRYVVAYGAIAAGIIQFIRGLTQLGDRR